MKDAYYFSHDSNAKDDPKCVLLIEQLGLEGYGAFWVLVETLRDQPDYKYPLKLIPALARKYNTSSEKVKAVILSYDLFEIENDTFFFSESLNRRMALFEEKRKKLSEAGKKGVLAKISQAQATLQPGCSHPQANKENQNKGNNTSSIEELEQSIPIDNIKRNFDGLIQRLRRYNIPDKEICEIVKVSNYGQIGHLIWSLCSTIDCSNGQIHTPASFLLSRLKQ
jgi:hypothetical protein